MKTALLLAFTLLLANTSSAQPYVETFEVQLHSLDVVVTDRKGQPVRDLREQDFEILENGQPQDITNFAIYDSAAGRAEGAATAAGQEVAAEPPPPRRFVFFIDEIAVQGVARRKLFEQVRSFVRSMRPGDTAAVIRPVGAKNVAQELTGDRDAVERALKQAIDESRITAEHAPLREIQALTRQINTADGNFRYGSVFFAKKAYIQTARRRVAHRLGQLRATVAAMAGLDGRKIVVVVTQGLTANPGEEVYSSDDRVEVKEALGGTDETGDGGGDVLASEGADQDDGTSEQDALGIGGDFSTQIEDLANTAAAHGVTIYALEPDVPIAQSVKGDAAGRPTVRNRGTALESFGSIDPLPKTFLADHLQNAARTLTTLTENTGGKWFRGLGSIDDIFHQVTRDLEVYYSLAYHARGEAGKPRSIEVRLRNRPELRVRTRKAVLDSSTTREMQDLVVASLLYPRQVNELGIAVTAGRPEPARGHFMVPIDISLPLDRLTFLPDAEGKYRATISVHFAAAGEVWDFASGGERDQEVVLTAAQYEERATTTYRYRTRIEVARGRVKVAFGVLDQVSKLSGFATLEVNGS